MKKRRNGEDYFIKVLEEEREYRAATSGDQADQPFITPLLFSLRDSLRAIEIILSLFLGVMVALLFILV